MAWLGTAAKAVGGVAKMAGGAAKGIAGKAMQSGIGQGVGQMAQGVAGLGKSVAGAMPGNQPAAAPPSGAGLGAPIPGQGTPGVSPGTAIGDTIGNMPGNFNMMNEPHPEDPRFNELEGPQPDEVESAWHRIYDGVDNAYQGVRAYQRERPPKRRPMPQATVLPPVRQRLMPQNQTQTANAGLMGLAQIASSYGRR